MRCVLLQQPITCNFDELCIIVHAQQVRCCHPDEGRVQDARNKAAAAGVPSSEPMTLQELEAVQHKMAAKLKQAKSFVSGEQFLPLEPPSTQQLPDDGQSSLHMVVTNPYPVSQAALAVLCLSYVLACICQTCWLRSLVLGPELATVCGDMVAAVSS